MNQNHFPAPCTEPAPEAMPPQTASFPQHTTDATDTPDAVWDVAVIGSGFSGTAVAIHLMRGLPAGARLLLLEQAPTPGRGLAYSGHCASHWLNVPAGRLGMDPQDEGGFLRWLAERRCGVRGADFVPRTLMGDYLADSLQQALETARLRGVQVLRQQGQVQDLHPLIRTADTADTPHAAGQASPTAWRLTLDTLPAQTARQVVLATGFGTAYPPALPGGQTWNAPGLIAAPLAAQALESIGEMDEVLILGSGLTAVDVITALQDQGHLGPIRVLSRRGLWPRAHRSLEARPVVGGSALERLGSVTRPRLLLRAVRAWVAQSAAQGQDWRDVMASLRPVTPALWQRLSLRDQRQFLRHLAIWWDVHRHRMAPGIHARLQAERERGRLCSSAGRLCALAALPDGQWQVHWQPRTTDPAGQASPAQVHTVRAILNCTGASTRLHAGHSVLLRRLHERGLLSADALGLGLRVDEQRRPLDAQGHTRPGLYYVGPMLKARHWEAIAIPELREHARAVASTVLAALAASSTTADPDGTGQTGKTSEPGKADTTAPAHAQGLTCD